MICKQNTPSVHTKPSTRGQRLEVGVDMVAVSTPSRFSEFLSLYHFYALANVSDAQTRVYVRRMKKPMPAPRAIGRRIDEAG